MEDQQSPQHPDNELSRGGFMGMGDKTEMALSAPQGETLAKPAALVAPEGTVLQTLAAAQGRTAAQTTAQNHHS